MTKKNRLQEVELLQNIASETRNALWEKGSVKKVSRGEIFIWAKQPENQVIFQLKGKSMIYNLTHEGKRKIIFVAGPGSLLNEQVLGMGTAYAYGEALEPGEIFCILKKEFRECMKKDFSLTEAVLGAQERKIWRLEHQLKNTMGSIYMERKLAAKLWKLAKDFGKETAEGIEIDFPITITLLADMLGTPRETASRICKMLLDQGLIKIERKRVTIVDEQKISHFFRTGEIS